ncbi:MAG TPA: hypothetical protein VHG29_02655 [Novosphingobium sp.]|nr:hypothetical protein [Novosphingobium sp.]
MTPLVHSAAGRGGPRRATALAAALGLGILALLGLTGRVAERPHAPSALDAIGPGKLGALRSLRLNPDGRPARGIAAVARSAMTGNPLAFEPFFGIAAAGFSNTATGSLHDGALLREAVRRNPRAREARALLLRQAVGQRKLPEAINQLAVLNQLGSAPIDQLMLALGKAIVTERQVTDVVAALAPHPELYAPFLRGFGAAAKPAALTVRAITDLPPKAMGDPIVRQLAISQLVGAGEFGAARALWRARLAKPSTGLVHSPDFIDTRAPPPFNWDLTINEIGAAERDIGGGLLVDYYGRLAGVLASQLLTLAPGQYVAVLDYRSTSGAPGNLALELRCATGDVLLAARPLDGKIEVAQTIRLGFAVPSGACPAQALRLVGRLGEVQEAQRIDVRRLDVVRAEVRP